MGLYERDYAKDDDDNSWGYWFEAKGVIVAIGICVAMFFLQLFTTPTKSGKITSSPTEVELILTSNSKSTKKIIDGDTSEAEQKNEAENNNQAKETDQNSRNYFQAVEKAVELNRKSYDSVRQMADLYVPKILKGEFWRVLSCFWVQDLHGIFNTVFSLLIITLLGKNLEKIIGGKEVIAFFVFAGITTSLLIMIGKILHYYYFYHISFFPLHSLRSYCAASAISIAFFTLFTLINWDSSLHFSETFSMKGKVVFAIFTGINLLFMFQYPDVGEKISVLFCGILMAWVYHRSRIRLMDFFFRQKSQKKSRNSNLRIVKTNADADNVKRELVYNYSEFVNGDQAERKKTDFVDEQFEAKVDKILDKVKESGQDSLTTDEKSVLLKASELYRKRRGQ